MYTELCTWYNIMYGWIVRWAGRVVSSEGLFTGINTIWMNIWTRTVFNYKKLITQGGGECFSPPPFSTVNLKSGSLQEPGRHLTIYTYKLYQAKQDGTLNEPALTNAPPSHYSVIEQNLTINLKTVFLGLSIYLRLPRLGFFSFLAGSRIRTLY